jgi:para-nitrobenzyl esterase
MNITVQRSLYAMAFALLFSQCAPKQPQNPLQVSTKHGTVEGYLDEDVYTFKGIPYAKAERFMPPQDPDAWQDVKECKEYGKVAKQIVAWIDDANMDEKTLFSVNVWTKGVNDGKKRPVMLWLHGGGFFIGSSSDPMTDGKNLAHKGDVVMVSVNHRLNILGFLDLSGADEKYAQSANVGMLDIVKALEWIKDNIANFGGDPSNVTIFGESGGGGKVGTLLGMPSAKGLFNKAIIQSGTLVNTMNSEKSQQLGLTVLKKLGIEKDNLAALDTVNYFTLVKAGNDAIAELAGPRRPGMQNVYGFSPSADGKVLIEQPFSPGLPSLSDNIPVLIGSTLNEMINTAYGEKDLTLEQAKERLAKQYKNRTDEFVALYAKTYPDYTPQDLVSIDTIFRPFTIRTADARSKQTSTPIYSYFLAWKSPVDDFSKGSFHGLDIPLAFNNVDIKPDWTSKEPEAYKLAEVMSSVWLNFVKTGNPNVEGVLPHWEPYTQENGATMYFDNENRIVNNHDRELMQFARPL